MKLKFMKIGLLAAVICATAFTGTGCAWSIGGREDKGASTTSTNPTRGQELIDLKRAHDQGALSDEEYKAQRQRILDARP
jgi:hypothetical protein